MTESNQVPANEDRLARITSEELVPLAEEMRQADFLFCKDGSEIWEDFNGLPLLITDPETSGDFVCLPFLAFEEVCTFMNIVATYDESPGSLYQRMLANNRKDLNNWKYQACSGDAQFESEEDEATDTIEEGCGVTQILFPIKVFFPLSDLPVVRDRLRSYVANKRKLETVEQTHEPSWLPVSLGQTRNYLDWWGRG